MTGGRIADEILIAKRGFGDFEIARVLMKTQDAGLANTGFPIGTIPYAMAL
jgi:hypothetical protein